MDCVRKSLNLESQSVLDSVLPRFSISFRFCAVSFSFLDSMIVFESALLGA